MRKRQPNYTCRKIFLLINMLIGSTLAKACFNEGKTFILLSQLDSFVYVKKKERTQQYLSMVGVY